MSGDSNRRLIEDYLPVRELNEIAAKEKKHPEHPVALIHYWPARRPITACRAAIYAALVPAPEDISGRKSASKFVTSLANFNVVPSIVSRAVAEIRAANGGQSPKVLDLFAGGGAIPLEAARLGCAAVAVDYNPIAHIVELCTLVYPQRFGASLADDVARWGKLVLSELEQKVGDWYPKVRVANSKALAVQLGMFGGEHARAGDQPASYIWVRTVPCRNPQCDATVPLVRQSWLRKKAVLISAVPKLKDHGRTIHWEIEVGSKGPGEDENEQTGSGGAQCLACTTPASAEYVKECGIAGKIGETLAAFVLPGPRSKVYLPGQLASAGNTGPDVAQIARTAGIDLPTEELKGKLRDQLPSYGFATYKDAFTTRQLAVLIILAKIIKDTHQRILADGVERDRALAITTYLGMAFGRFANSFTRFCRWQSRDQITIAAIGDRQALKMIYDFSEINPFAETAGCLPFALESEVQSIRVLATVGEPGEVIRCSAEELPFQDSTFDAVVTDPPYYSSIFYSDLSSFFYVWLRRTIGDLYREHFVLPAPPKKREAVAQASEHGGDDDKATKHYENIMSRAFVEAGRVLKPGAPFVCVYAHKTTAGWASLIRALIPAGLTVTEAWPLQTEARGRTNAIGAAALSDSIFLVARRRGNTNTIGQYEETVQPELQRIARERVSTLWDLGFSGADLVIASVGAGLRAFTQYARVEYANGDEVPAERFLAEVESVVLDAVLERLSNAVGSRANSRYSLAGVDPATRFYVLWRYTYDAAELDAGEAIIFAHGTHVELDGMHGLSAGARALVQKKKEKYRLLDYTDRGDDSKVGMPLENGSSAPVVDVLHRLLWLMERHPAGIAEFLKNSRANLEQLRLVAQALSGPALKGGELGEVGRGSELSALGKLTANWRSVVEGAGEGPLFSAALQHN